MRGREEAGKKEEEKKEGREAIEEGEGRGGRGTAQPWDIAVSLPPHA